MAPGLLCCVARSSKAAAFSLFPRSLRLVELINFNLWRVLMVSTTHTPAREPAGPRRGMEGDRETGREGEREREIERERQRETERDRERGRTKRPSTK